MKVEGQGNRRQGIKNLLWLARRGHGLLMKGGNAVTTS